MFGSARIARSHSTPCSKPSFANARKVRPSVNAERRCAQRGAVPRAVGAVGGWKGGSGAGSEWAALDQRGATVGGAAIVAVVAVDELEKLQHVACFLLHSQVDIFSHGVRPGVALHAARCRGRRARDGAGCSRDRGPYRPHSAALRWPNAAPSCVRSRHTARARRARAYMPRALCHAAHVAHVVRCATSVIQACCDRSAGGVSPAVCCNLARSHGAPRIGAADGRARTSRLWRACTDACAVLCRRLSARTRASRPRRPHTSEAYLVWDGVVHGEGQGMVHTAASPYALVAM
jgi:hypothetical protein